MAKKLSRYLLAMCRIRRQDKNDKERSLARIKAVRTVTIFPN